MNINLTAAASKKTKKDAPANKSSTNVFAADDEKEVEDETEQNRQPSSRAGVNQALRNEQEALRKRALRLIEEAPDSSMYDYDGQYETFQPQKTETKEPVQEERGSRYVEDLLKMARKRKHERDIVHEKKVAREQEAEDAEMDYRGKEKFVTAAYKRKLEERELWQAEDERQRLEDEANDVTKQTGGVGMANFYGSLNKNVALGGGSNDREEKNCGNELTQSISKEDETFNFADGFERAPASPPEHDADFRKLQSTTGKLSASHSEDGIQDEKKNLREIRKQKVKAALERYRKRHGLSAEQ